MIYLAKELTPLLGAPVRHEGYKYHGARGSLVVNDPGPTPEAVRVRSSAVAEAYRLCAHAAQESPKDTSRLHLRCVFVRGSTIVATNGHVLSTAPSPLPPLQDVSLPTCPAFRRWARANPIDAIERGEAGEHHFWSGQTKVTLDPPAMRYPPFEWVFDSVPQGGRLWDARGMLAYLARVESHEKVAALGIALDLNPVYPTRASCDWYANARYIARAVRSLNCRMVEISTEEHGRPIFITEPNGTPTRIEVVMPVATAR